MTVGVVGAGITGLSVVHELAAHEADVVAFEAAGEPGGVLRSERLEGVDGSGAGAGDVDDPTASDGVVVEWGPQRLRLAEPVAELVADLGLEDDVRRADGDLPLYVHADGRLREVPLSVRAFLRTDLVSWRGKLRALGEPLTGPLVDPDRPGESAAAAFRRTFGAECSRNAIEPLFGGIYGSDPEAMPAEHALDSLRRAERRHGSLLRAAISRLRGDSAPPPATFADGLQSLPRALYDEHRPYVHLDAPASGVERLDDGGLELRAGGRSVTVEELVVTAPAPTAASLLGELPGADVAGLGELTYNSLVLVQLRADADVEGFGYQVRRDEGLRTRGVTFQASLFDRDGLYTAFLGGMGDEDVLEWSDEELGAVAAEEFEGVVGAEAEVLAVRRLPEVLPAYDGSWAAIEELELPDDVHLPTNYTGRLGISSRVREARRLAGELVGSDSE